MGLKILIVLLFICVIISLSSAMVFLLKDIGDQRKRSLYALGVRVAFASALVITVAYGVATGRLSSTAPWDQKLHPENTVTPP